MAIQTQYPYINDEGRTYSNLIRTYSDNNKMILQVETGDEYEDAVDIYPTQFTYTETDKDIPQYEDDENE